MAITKPSDLFDFDAWHRELERLESRKEKYSQSVIQSNERIKKSYDEQIAKLKSINDEMRAMVGSQLKSAAISNMGKEIDKIISALDSYEKHLQAVSNSEKINELAIEQLTKSLKALETEYKRLDPTSDSFASDQQRISGQVKQVTSAINAQSQTLKVAKKTVDEAGNSYSRLSRQTADMKTQLRNLDGAFDLNTGKLRTNNTEAAKLARQIKINDAALKQMDATMGNHQRNVGNYASGIRGLGLTMRGALTTFFGVTSAFEAISQSLLIIDEFTRLKLGLDAVSDSSQQVSARFSFISTLADKTGQDISKLSGSYTSFAAAARNTTLEGKAGDAIFKSFSNSFSALGKSSEVAERGLYAVQQMISKGKVSSEELNQQLAEALPGANKLFADAMKLSTAELADQMKKGKILATDVLPKVAVMLEKIYGDRAQLNTTTISGSFTRFTNQIKLLLDEMNKDGVISKFFASINNGLADTTRGIARLIEKQGLWKTSLSGIRALIDPFGAAASSIGGKLAGTGGQSLKDQARESKMLDEFKNDDTQGRVARLTIELNRLQNAKQKLASMDSKDAIIRGREYKQQEVFIANQKRFVEDLILANKDLIAVETAAAYKKAKPTGGGDGDDKDKKRELNAWEKLVKEAEEYRDVIANQIVANFNAGKALEISPKAKSDWDVMYAKLIAISTALGDDIPKGLREINDALHPKTVSTPALLASRGSVTQLGRPANKDGSSAGNPITDATDKLVGLPNLLSAQGAEMSHLKTQLDTGKFSRYLDAQKQAVISQLANIQQLEIQAQFASTDAERKGIEERITLAKDELARKKEIIKTEVEARKEVQKQLFNLAVEASNAAFTILSDQNAAKIEQNRAVMEHELSLVKGNQAAEDKIKETYAKKDLELRRKQAKLDKAQAIFSIGLSTAQAIASALKTFPVPLGIALAAIAGAMGAVQLAAAVAKPLPQFYKGTKNAPEGPAQVGEKGAEIRESKGKMYYYDKPTVTHLERGDKIYTAEETSRMLANSSRAAELNAITNVTDANSQSRADIIKYQVILMKGNNVPVIDYNKMRDSFVAALDENPTPQTIFDEHGFSSFMRNKNTRVQSFNRRYSLSN